MRSIPTLFDEHPSDAWTTNRKGNVAEAAIAFHAARLGIEVFRPVFEHGRYDLVLEIGGRLQRVQCKWAQRTGDVIAVRLASSRYTPGGYVKTTYNTDEIDLVAAYCADLDRCYVLPADLVSGRTYIQLRLAPTKNQQRAGLNWAAQYELTTVATQKPTANDEASTVEGEGSLTLPPWVGEIVVSAHDFRGQFGHYMELAANGEEIAVTRHGRPFVRLTAATRLSTG